MTLTLWAGLLTAALPFTERAELTIALVPLAKSVNEADVRRVFAAVKGIESHVETVRREAYPGLGLGSLEYSTGSLTASDRAAVEKAANVVSVVVSWPRSDSQRLRVLYAVIADVAAAQKSIVFDRRAVNAYAVADWRTRRLDRGWSGEVPIGSMHFMVHLVPQDNGLVMLDTGGLPRFGIEDIELLDVNRAAMSPAGNLMNALAQRLIEGEVPDANGRITVRLADLREPGLRASLTRSLPPNAKQTLVVDLVPADVARGAREGALELHFPELRCSDRGECLDAAIEQLFGAKEPSLQTIKHDAVVDGRPGHEPSKPSDPMKRG